MQNKEIRMALALLRFKEAFNSLVVASKQLPDLDVSEGYPFYLLDFETLDKPVAAWAVIHASKLLQEAPDRIVNPACLECEYVGQGTAANGLCKGSETKDCSVFPYAVFTKETVLPALLRYDFKDNQSFTEIDYRLAYERLLEVKIDEATSSTEQGTV